MKDFRVPLEDQIVAQLQAAVTDLAYIAANSRVGLSKPTAYPAATVTYEGFRKTDTTDLFGGVRTLIQANFVVTLATSSGQAPGVVQPGPTGAPELLNAIFLALRGFLLDFADPDLETPWPCVIEEEIPYEINGQIASWQQVWSVQIHLAGFAP